MTISDLQRLYDYGYWANARLSQVISELTPEQFTQDLAGSYASIRNTLVHVLSAEWGWLDRRGAPERGPALRPDDYPTFQALVKTWSNVERYVRAFLSKLRDEDLARIVAFTARSGRWSWESFCSTRPITVFIIGGRSPFCFGC